MNASRRASGFTLVELLVGLMLTGLVAAAVGQMLWTHQRASLREDLHVAMEENLRMAMGMIADPLRSAGCGVPASSLDQWIPWAPGFVDDPIVIGEGGASPDSISFATCTAPVATLAADAAAGATTLTLTSAVPGKAIDELLNPTDKRLVMIDGEQPAHVVAASAGGVTIDTDPTTAGNQGLPRTTLSATPLARVDVFTFAVATGGGAVPWLALDKHRGAAQPIADGISDLQVTSLAGGSELQVTLTARTERVDPVSGTVPTRSLTSVVTRRN